MSLMTPPLPSSITVFETIRNKSSCLRVDQRTYALLSSIGVICRDQFNVLQASSLSHLVMDGADIRILGCGRDVNPKVANLSVEICLFFFFFFFCFVFPVFVSLSAREPSASEQGILPTVIVHIRSMYGTSPFVETTPSPRNDDAPLIVGQFLALNEMT